MDHGGASIIKAQQDLIIDTIRNTTRGDWKILVIDETVKRIFDNVVKEDDILNQNIANIERIEERREMNPEMDAIYILSPEPHIVECLLLDLQKRRYRSPNVFFTGVVNSSQSRKLTEAGLRYRSIFIDFYPRESHLVTFRDKSSFPILYSPNCANLANEHLDILAQRIAAVCIAMGENPKVRYYKPRNASYRASGLSEQLAQMVQTELKGYSGYDPSFGQNNQRPQGVLLITDRSMDLMAPLLHEFTYQAMAHDLLPIKDEDKVTFHMTINEGTPAAEEKDMEISEKDKVWVENRHRHMKDTIEKLMGDFQKFIDQNPNFTNQNQDTTSLNAIKDMLAGLPQFQEMKEAYSLHLTMAQEAMNIFQRHKLSEVASVEQTLATGLDEDYKKAKNILDQAVRLLDDDAVSPEDRLRLIALYVLYRDGVIPEDIDRLLMHSRLPPQEKAKITNLELLGARPTHKLKEPRTTPAPGPLFHRNPKTISQMQEDDYALSRYEPAVKQMLEDLVAGTLDQVTFPYTEPPPEGPNSGNQFMQGGGSLRSAAPRWASANRRVVENRQRILVFVAGGATYSEARACYEASEKMSKDIYLLTSHMLTPREFLSQLFQSGLDRRRMGLPQDAPKPRVPDHFFERERPPAPPPTQSAPPRMGPGGGVGLPGGPAGGGGMRPPVKAMGAMTLNSGGGGRPEDYRASSSTAASASTSASSSVKIGKDGKEKKKRNIFGLKKS